MTIQRNNWSMYDNYISFSRLYKGLHEEFTFKGASADTHRYVRSNDSRLPDNGFVLGKNGIIKHIPMERGNTIVEISYVAHLRSETKRLKARGRTVGVGRARFSYPLLLSSLLSSFNLRLYILSLFLWYIYIYICTYIPLSLSPIFPSMRAVSRKGASIICKRIRNAWNVVCFVDFELATHILSVSKHANALVLPTPTCICTRPRMKGVSGRPRNPLSERIVCRVLVCRRFAQASVFSFLGSIPFLSIFYS